MANTIDTILLLALPASGKSEVRRYLASLSPEECENDFHMGPTVQLDDFPYVHMMRRIDDELAAVGKERVFFNAADKPFKTTKDWGTLIHLINEDYEDLVSKEIYEPQSAAMLLFERFDRASQKAGAPARLENFDQEVKQKIADSLEKEAREMLDEKHQGYPDTLEGKTLVIEFARGGPQGSSMPLPDGYGYNYSLAELSENILANASILYIWVTPEESRRKNDQRADPDDPGSILHHGVPIAVMLGDYGCDDMDWLEEKAEKPGCVTVEAHGKKFNLPVGRVDNRVDKTTFIRNDLSQWKAEEVQAIRQEIKQAMDSMFKN
jgi:hypothetical protein